MDWPRSAFGFVSLPRSRALGKSRSGQSIQNYSAAKGRTRHARVCRNQIHRGAVGPSWRQIARWAPSRTSQNTDQCACLGPAGAASSNRRQMARGSRKASIAGAPGAQSMGPRVYGSGRAHRRRSTQTQDRRLPPERPRALRIDGQHDRPWTSGRGCRRVEGRVRSAREAETDQAAADTERK